VCEEKVTGFLGDVFIGNKRAYYGKISGQIKWQVIGYCIGQYR